MKLFSKIRVNPRPIGRGAVTFRVLATSLEEAHELGAKCAGQTVRVIEL